jgi:hypothetical protein
MTKQGAEMVAPHTTVPAIDKLQGVPKTIYSLWLQGAESAPDLVKCNFRRWQLLNPEYHFRILELRDVRQLLADTRIDVDRLSAQALSDIVRARLLLENGGVWVDAALYPVRPLGSWLPGVVSQSGFFAFSKPAPDRPISSWFLACTAGHVVLERWWRQIVRYWAQPRELVPGIPSDPARMVSPAVAEGSNQFPYFWFHYLFQHLLDTDLDVAAYWSAMPKVSANLAHELQFLCESTGFSVDSLHRALTAAPVQKMNWRAGYPLDVLEQLAPSDKDIVAVS